MANRETRMPDMAVCSSGAYYTYICVDKLKLVPYLPPDKYVYVYLYIETYSYLKL